MARTPPPNQYTTSTLCAWKSTTSAQANAAAAAPMAAASCVRRGSTAQVTTSSAAEISGIATGSGTTQLIRGASRRRGRPFAGLAVDVKRQRQDQRDHRHADDDVGQSQRLHDRVDGGRAELHTLEDGGAGVRPEPDGQQQDIGRGLGHG